MAKGMAPEAVSADDDKKRIQDERKQLKKQQKEQRKEAKARAKEISRQEEELGLDEGNGLVTFGATVLIVLLWIAVICVIVKLDIGGFGSSVLTPILKDVPVVNKILPGSSQTETNNPGSYGGYSSLQEAVDYIKQLEVELEQVRTASNSLTLSKSKNVSQGKYRTHTVFKAYHNSSSEQIVKNSATVTY